MLSKGLKAIKKNVVPMVLVAGFAAGCSPYPEEGSINTQIITDRAKLVDARGDVHGLQSGTMKKAEQYVSDATALYSYPDAVFQAYMAEKAIPDLTLVFPAVESAPEMSNFKTLVVEDIEAQIATTEAEVDADIAERNEAIAKLNKEKAEVTAQSAKFNALIAEEKAALKAAQKTLEAAESRADNAFSAGLASINKTLTQSGLDPFSERLNPLTKYRYIDFAEKSVATPASCPDQGSRFTTVDARDEIDICFYIGLNDTYQAKSDAIAEATKPALIEYVTAHEELGQKGGWGRDATGAHLVLASAEKEYQSALSAARSKFGYNDQRERAIERINMRIASLQEEIDTYSADGFVIEELLGYRDSISLSDDVRQIGSSYLRALKSDIATGIEKATPVQFDKESEGAVFSGLDGDYEGIIVLAEFVAERDGRRDVAGVVELLDLRSDTVKEADKLTVNLDQNSFEAGRRVDMDNPQDIEHEMVNLLVKTARKNG